ncbi:hypothetical protein D3OALGB2SA_3563 [Olavius algarvensis associated proteobacterium Delta 3]|nr:hypothetical protein D3OALGB2SA_3563 [Olavius algarvensis associated proteobacterium Delta 3]
MIRWPTILLLFVIASAGWVWAEETAKTAGQKPEVRADLITSDQFIDALRIKGPAGEYPKAKLQALPNTETPQAQVTINILFKSGSTELADDFSVRQVQEAGQALSSDALAGYYFEIAGHTDNVGSEEKNLRLSQERAEAIKQFFINYYGISPERLFARGYGESIPMATNDTDENRAKNRRVVFIRIDKPEMMIKEIEKKME